MLSTRADLRRIEYYDIIHVDSSQGVTTGFLVVGKLVKSEGLLLPSLLTLGAKGAG